MRPDVVTFWHGPLDRLRQLCLRSQIAAGHRVTVYSFDPLAGLPDGVANADAEAVLLKPVEIDPAKPYFAWEQPRQLGNSVLYLPPDASIVTAFENLMAQEELTPDWLALRHRLTFAL